MIADGTDSLGSVPSVLSMQRSRGIGISIGDVDVSRDAACRAPPPRVVRAELFARLSPVARLAARTVRRAAGRCPPGAGPIRARRARRTAPLVRRRARGDVQGDVVGPVLAVGRRRAPRATDAPVEGGLRAPGRASAAARMRRCVRVWSITAVCVGNGTIRMSR